MRPAASFMRMATTGAVASPSQPQQLLSLQPALVLLLEEPPTMLLPEPKRLAEGRQHLARRLDSFRVVVALHFREESFLPRDTLLGLGDVAFDFFERCLGSAHHRWRV